MKRDTYHIRHAETLHDGWGCLQAITYELADAQGHRTEHTGEVYDAGNAAAVLPYDAARGTVLLVRQFRIAAARNDHPDGMLLEVPAGKIEGGLSPEATVRKELREETGYQLQALEPVAALYMSPGAFSERLHLFTAPYTPAEKKEAGGGNAEEGESVTLLELTFADAWERMKQGSIVDAKTVLLLQHAALYQLLPLPDAVPQSK